MARDLRALFSLTLVLATAACGQVAGPEGSAGSTAAGVGAGMDAWDTSHAQGMPPTQQSEADQSSGAPQQVLIMDPQGTGQPMPAATILIPVGWQTQGGVRWDRSTACVGNQMRMQWRALSADGREVYEIIPGYNWQVQGTQIQMNPCPALPISSAREFLQQVAQQHRPGARIVDYRDRTDEARALAAQHGQAQTRVDAGTLLIAHARNGEKVREMLTATLNFNAVQGNVVAGTSMVTAYSAPEARFDPALAQRIASSMKPNPTWLAALRDGGVRAANDYGQQQSAQISAWHNDRMAQINARGAADRSAIRAQTARDVNAISNAGFQNRMDSMDRMQRSNVDTINEVQRYRDPVSGQDVSGSIHDQNAWRTSNGEYFSTDDPAYNPSDYGVDAQEMEKADP